MARSCSASSSKGSNALSTISFADRVFENSTLRLVAMLSIRRLTLELSRRLNWRSIRRLTRRLEGVEDIEIYREEEGFVGLDARFVWYLFPESLMFVSFGWNMGLGC